MDRLFPPGKKKQNKTFQPLRRFLSYPEADAMRPGNRFERNRYKFVIFTGCSTMQHPCVLVGCSGWFNPYSPQHGLLWYLQNSVVQLLETQWIDFDHCSQLNHLLMQTPPVRWTAQICQTWIKLSHEKKPYYFPLYWLVNRDPYNGSL